MRRNKRSRVSAAIARFIGDESGFARILLDVGGGETDGAGGGAGAGAGETGGSGGAGAGGNQGGNQGGQNAGLAASLGNISFNPHEDDGVNDGSGQGGNQGGNNQGGGQARQPADPNLGGQGGNQGGQGQAQGWRSIRDVAAQRGYQVDPSITDDEGFLDHLLGVAQNSQASDFYARLGRQLEPHAGQFGEFLTQQRQPKAPEAEAPKPWQAPEYDPRWANLVQFDQASGLYVGKAGVPESIVSKVNKFAEWKERYDRNPGEMFNGMVQEAAAKIADERISARLAEHNQTQAVQTILQANDGWLFARDANKAKVYRNGQPVLSEAGAIYAQHVDFLRKSGVSDPRTQDTLAQVYVRGQLAIGEAAKKATGANGGGQGGGNGNQGGRGNQGGNQGGGNQSLSQAMNQGGNRGSSGGDNGGDGGGSGDTRGLTLAESMRRDLRANGIDDDTFRNMLED